MKILIVEDHPKLASFIKKGLTAQGYTIEMTDSGGEAEELCAGIEYDLIILDVNLPDQNGLETARNLRRDGFSNPILMLTALSTTKDKINGLDSGADDYLTKPFDFEELLARIRALMRRKHNAGEILKLQYGDIELDLVQRKATRENREIILTAKEFSLLEYFLRNPDRPITRTQISENVWDINFDSNTNVVDVYINMLRKKIDHPYEKKMIHTMVGYGYILKST